MPWDFRGPLRITVQQEVEKIKDGNNKKVQPDVQIASGIGG